MNNQLEKPIHDSMTATARSLKETHPANLNLYTTDLDLYELLREVKIRFDTNPKFYQRVDYLTLLALLLKIIEAEGGSGNIEIDPTVPAWAKLPNKPTYTASEVGALPVNTPIPSKTSDLINDSGFMSNYVETDPTVPEWAKANLKPSYTAAEIGALPDDTVIPTKTSDLENDSGFITSYTETDPTVPAWAKTEHKPSYDISELSDSQGKITEWNAKLDAISDLSDIRSGAALGATALLSFTETDPTVPAWAKQSSKPTYTAVEVGALPDSTVIPSKTSDLTNDSGFLTQHLDISGKADKVSSPTANDFAGLDASGNLIDSGHKHSDYAAASHTHSLYLTSSDITSKADKVTSAVNGNFAGLDSNGNLTDSGSKASDFATSSHVHSDKADKVSSATNGNFAGLDSNGNLTDSGYKHSDYAASSHTHSLYLTLHLDITGKADKVTSATNGNFAGLDSNGNLTDSGHKHSDYAASTHTHSEYLTANDITGKTDKVTSATNGNFASLDSNGNLADSGHKHSDYAESGHTHSLYLTEHQDITGKADKVSSSTAGNFAGLDADGNLTDSGSKASDFLTSHQNIKTLDTTATTTQSTSASEAVTGSGTITLHKISKTGSYNDLLNLPTIPDAIPTGAILMWYTSTAPTGWLLCNGLSIADNDDYAALRTVLGTNTVPDLLGKFPLGVSTTHTLGSTGGDETVTLDTTLIPSHSHNISNVYHGNSIGGSSGEETINTNSSTSTSVSVLTLSTVYQNATDATGGGQAHNNMPPYLTVNFIIKYT